LYSFSKKRKIALVRKDDWRYVVCGLDVSTFAHNLVNMKKSPPRVSPRVAKGWVPRQLRGCTNDNVALEMHLTETSAWACLISRIVCSIGLEHTINF